MEEGTSVLDKRSGKETNHYGTTITIQHWSGIISAQECIIVIIHS